MTTSIVGLEDIIDEVKKNIKMVFQNEVRAEDRQKVYIIGLQLTLDRLARDNKKEEQSQKDQLETSQLDYNSSSLISPILAESAQALMNSLDKLEDMINLIKSDLKKLLPFDINDPDLLYNEAKPEKESAIQTNISK
ncbi:hypothetical protein RclHR1_31470003 [Rhizophagus clarus]|uniref:Uncharacterized protein n=1 Tax=Rhizophagus clarus TaxID=94130 RepID=A0A2Z6RJ83_9GLOM|nr:hypothetical protein RclHR1_31470003 [Rhizophagus clarus]